MRMETGLFLHRWDTTRPTFTFANKTRGCCHAGCQEWVVGVAGRRAFQQTAQTERRLLSLRLWNALHARTLHNFCAHFNQCLNPAVYVATVTTPTPCAGRFQVWKQQTHLPLIPRVKGAATSSRPSWWMFWQVLLSPAGCTSVRSIEKLWKTEKCTCTHSKRLISTLILMHGASC